MANSFTPFSFFFFLPSSLFILMITTTTMTVLENVVVKGEPDLTFISYLCGAEHDVGSLRKDQARRLTGDAVKYTGPGDSLACGGTLEEPYMYYRATCSPAFIIPPADCAACVAYAGDQLVNQNVCGDQWGAQITLASCFLRFETYQIAECPPPM